MQISEKQFLNLCKKLIEEKLNWEDSSNWKERDYKNLSELIFDKTQILLSLSTLKRIWKKDFGNVPHPGTLNALVNFLGFKNWPDFKQHAVESIVEDVNKSQSNLTQRRSTPFSSLLRLIPKRSLVRIISAVIIGIIGLSVIILITQQGDKNYNSVLFSSKTAVMTGVPNTVIFDYDVSMVESDSIFIQETWNPKGRILIPKDKHQYRSIYFYPGIHKAKLLIDNQVVKEHNLFIKTDGWLPLVRYALSDLFPVYIPKEEIFHKGKLYAFPETLEKNNVKIKDKPFLLSFYNIKDFGIDADNFKIETLVKNDLQEGGITCQYFLLTMYTESGRMHIPLCDKGCVAGVSLQFIDKAILGKSDDLSMFGCDMSKWNKLWCWVENRKVTINLNDKKIYELSYDTHAGKLMGLHLLFAGCGSADYIKLFNKDNEVIFQDDFDR